MYRVAEQPSLLLAPRELDFACQIVNILRFKGWRPAANLLNGVCLQSDQVAQIDTLIKL